MPHDSLVIIKRKNGIVICEKTSEKIKIPSKGFVIVLDTKKYAHAVFNKIYDMSFSLNLEFQSQRSDVKAVFCGAGMLLKNHQRCDIYDEFSHYCGNAHFVDEAAADFSMQQQQTYLIEDCHPRTALGVKPDGSIVLLIADGRSGTSIGLSLKDLQDIFIQCGCSDALNIGGGGCSTLIINNCLKNNPSQGGERPVSEALCCFKKTSGI